MNRRQILENIPIEKINILNPRERNRKIANEIKKNIEDVGLKRPITVSRRLDFTDGKEYDLVCGQGRLEIYAPATLFCNSLKSRHYIPSKYLTKSKSISKIY